jgi:hypothetical protein
MGNHFIEELPDGMQVVDVITPSAPVKVASTGFRGQSIDSQSGNVYLASGWNGVTVIDSTVPEAPTFAAEVKGNYAGDVKLHNGKLYVANGWQGMRIYDLADPLAPALQGQQATVASSFASDIAIDGADMAFIAAEGAAGLQAVDVSNPDNPEIQGWLSLNEAQALDVDGDYVFVASGNDGLKIVKKPSVTASTSVSPGAINFVVPAGTPLGVHDVTVLNPDGTILKSANLLDIDGPDADGDAIPDGLDNCALVANGSNDIATAGPSQNDTDSDDYGNMCDADFNNNGVVDSNDASVLFGAFGKNSGDPSFNPAVDLNGNGVIDSNDASILFGSFGSPPGPSGLIP